MSFLPTSPGARQLFLYGGVISSSYFFFGTLGATCFGVMPAIDPGQDLGTTAPLSVETRVALSKWHHDRTKITMFGSASISSASFLAAACLTAPGPLRMFLVVATLSSLEIIMYTLRTIMPIDNELAAAHESGSLRATAEDTEQGRRVIERLDTWKRVHRFRVVLGGWAWIFGLFVLVDSSGI